MHKSIVHWKSTKQTRVALEKMLVKDENLKNVKSQTLRRQFEIL